MSRITEFYRISAPAPGREMDDASRSKYYRRLRLQAFVSATLGYSLYYVCRTSLNVMKKPVLDSGSLDASQLGVIGSALLFAYAVGKFVNGFIADYCNIKRFMATGLIVSAAANALMGLLGLAHSVVPTTVIFVAFAVMWGLNGWAQSMGAPPAIISLSRWYPLNERGTYYGFFSASHNLGEFFSFLFVGSIVTFAGWQAGFFGSALAGAIGVLVVLCWLHDTPESKGLPPVEALAHEKPVPGAEKSVREIQKQVLRTPAVWVLAAASAFMYISRYAINGWGVLFLPVSYTHLLIGVVAFFIALYLSTRRGGKGAQAPSLGIVWEKFPKFIIGFVAASLVFSILQSNGLFTADAKGKLAEPGVAKMFSTVFFSLAFVCVGLDTRLKEIVSKENRNALWAFLAAQTFNIVVTLVIALVLFGVLKPMLA